MATKDIAITKQVQDALSPSSVLEDLLEGNRRFTNDNTQTLDNAALVMKSNYRGSKSQKQLFYLVLIHEFR